eukprot:TRINITY_DN4808_c0_g1_i13.p1 TRINITY_DN4808_c0_g1~~TRINITY_DN4808_c0_g1_i13.p1  ORF type:complete len:344 (+),score=72.49 TRINITY_DN4808_c0_g1_i13:92-1123(+)
MIRRPPRSTLSSSSAASDVYKRQELNDESDDADSCVQYGDSEGRVFFSDYAPATFKKLRKVCGMDEEHFQRALSCSGEYRMKLTEGLSYCNFYFLDDPSFMLKEVHPAEADKMIEMLPAMLLHLSHNPNSVMVRCVGLYKLSWHTTQNGVSSTRDEWVLCMANLFSTNLRFHQKYDLKGSREGRCVTAEELQMGTQGDFTLRDYAFEELESVIEIGPDMSSRFLEQLERDVQFLCSQNVMDYSLLVGVHHRENGAEENVQSSKLAAEYAHVKSVFEVENGGIPSADGTKIYFVGLVDTLTSYTAKKGWETVFKSCLFDPAQISSVEPPVYMERFMTCARERIK